MKKRDLRSLWIVRISAIAKQLGTSYSKVIDGLKKEKIEIDRKILSQLAVKNPDVVKKIFESFTSK